MAEKLYPRIWDFAAKIRNEERTGPMGWPDWCYLPFQAWNAIISQYKNLDHGIDLATIESGTPEEALEMYDAINDCGRIMSIGAWRMTRGIYRFDPDVYAPLIESGYHGDIPTEVLLRLPEWGIYIETPGLTFFDECVFGAFVSLDYDPPTKARELRMVLDCASNLVPVPLPFEHKTVEESFKSIKWGGIAQDENGKITTFAAQKMDIIPPIYGQVLPLILYLCSDEPDITGKTGRPGNPTPIRTKRGERLFAASGEKVWDVGVRMGSAIRKWTRAETPHVSDVSGTHASPRPHIRMAHWHGFWSGPRSGNRRFSLKWMPPIPVNMILGDESPAVIHPVRK